MTTRSKNGGSTARGVIQVIHGPNLNLTGIREPEVYGRETLAQIEDKMRALAKELGVETRFFQSNHEGALIDKIHEARTTANALLVNPGAFAHTSLALADAVRSVSLPCVEVHLSNLHKREQVRRHSFLAEAAVGVVTGFGSESYLLGLRAAAALARARK